MSTTTATTPTYQTQEHVLCYHGPLIYEAKVLKTKNYDEASTTTGAVGPHYLVHYKGWKQTWDEWVPGSRLLKRNDTNLALQKQLQQNAAAVAQSGSGASKEKNKALSAAGKGAADNLSTRTGARKDGGTRGTKRAREEDDNSKRTEMKLVIPEVLKTILVDDWESVTKLQKLVTVPRDPTVVDLLDEFAKYVRETKPAHLKEPTLVINTVVDGLRCYFDRALGSTLLYRFERVQYAYIRKQYWTGQNVVVGQEKEMSAIYGAEHLLRMLVTLPQMIASTTLDTESVTLIRDYANELMAWMAKEKDRIFQREYEDTPLGYQNVSRS